MKINRHFDKSQAIYSAMIMNQSDINNIVTLLSNAIRHEDWEPVEEALEYIQEFQDEPTQLEEE